MSFVARKDALSWGRVVRHPQYVASPRFRDELSSLVEEARGQTLLPVGLQRSYGDSVLNSQGRLISMAGLDRFIAFDAQNGIVRAEAGLTLGEIMRCVVPQGFFVPVTPGTRHVTLGGAIGNDVHGKNHHLAGSFGRHVTRLKLLRHDGEAVIKPTHDGRAGIFEATIAGLGLTGLIEWAEIKLQPISSGFLDVEIIPFAGLQEFWPIAEASTASHEHTVAWIDCTATGSNLGRGIFSRANWAAEGDLVAHHNKQRLSVPLSAPNGLLNRFTVRAFNELYYRAQKRKTGARLQHYGRFFHPLDGIAHWNKLYGGHGFWQYQCVIPPASAKDAIPAILGEIARSFEGSFLAVLKTFGALASPGLLSFPMEGATLALDFPHRGATTLALFSKLDSIVREAKGRLYAAKDGRIPKDIWAAGYANLETFLPFTDPALASDFWRRVAP